jgi:hypothetical protein
MKIELLADVLSSKHSQFKKTIRLRRNNKEFPTTTEIRMAHRDGRELHTGFGAQGDERWVLI